MTEINPPAYMQDGCYEAVQDRRLVASIICAQGVAFGACPEDGALTALKVIDSPTGGMNVRVEEGSAFIQGDTITCQGMYHVVNDGPVDILLTASDPVSNRVDLIIAIIRDSQYSGALDEWKLEKVTGTPGAGTPAAPANSLTLATIAVAATTGEIVAGNITDMRTSYVFCGDPATDALIAVVRFTSSGSFTKATYPRARNVRARVQAGGGAGGGSDDTAAGDSSAGGGGCSGGWSEGLIPVASLAVSETVTVGAGGTGVSAGTGNTGGNSSFGTHVTANGGPGGTSMPTQSVGDVHSNSVQAVAGTGNILAAAGDLGEGALRISGLQVKAGTGGGTPFGSGARGLVDITDSDGNAADANSGAGGGGAISRDAAGTANLGGAGGSGIVIVEVYG